MVQTPFNQDQKPPVPPSGKLPKEVTDYYQAEKRQRNGVTWLLGLATLMATILIAFGLFLGGRWAYREIADRNDKDTGTTATTSDNDQDKSDPTPASKDDTTDSTSDEDAQNDGDDHTTGAADIPANTGTVGKSTDDLPSTGPGNVVAIFAATSAAAGAGHYLVTKRRS